MSNDDIYNKKENCVVGDRVTYTWDGANFCWDDARVQNVEFCWGDVSILIAVGIGDTAGDNYDLLSEKEKDRFIVLVCKVKGYPATEETKKKVKLSLSIDDIQTTVMEGLSYMNVTIKN